jgi:hypothetical protein
VREIIVWALLVCFLGGAADRALLKLEERGWINYRKHGISRGAIAYHALELESIVNPGARQVMEVQFEQRGSQDDAGDPLGADSDEPPPA